MAGWGQWWWKRQWLLGVLDVPLAPDIFCRPAWQQEGGLKAGTDDGVQWPRLKGSFAKALALTPLRDKHSPPPSWSP